MIEQATIETTDGCFLTINGTAHPPDRYVGILSYIPFQPWHPGKLVSQKTIEGREYTKISRPWFSPYRDCFFKYVTGSGFGHYIYEDEFFGRVTAIPHDKIKRIIEPVPVSGAAVKACSMLGVHTDDAVLVGSNMLECNDHGDIDLGIIGKAAVTEALRRLRQLTEQPECQVYHDYFRRPHPRQFNCEGRKIDIFSLYGELKQSILPVGEDVVVDDLVTDDADADFCPATYRLSNGLFVSYQIEHRMILRPGDRIKIRAKKADGNIFLVRLGDDYEDPTDGKYRFIDPEI